MPVPGFLASIADKAQSAINASPLAGHIPTGSHGSSHGAHGNANPNRPSSPDPAPQPAANEAAAGGGPKSHTLEALSYQFRALQQQYSSTTPVQKIITIEKGVSMDFDNVSRDAKAQSKELYTWGQGEADDLKDVTDRLAYLNFVQGSLATSLAHKLNTARVPIKALRDAETALAPRRTARTNLQTQIAKLEHDQAGKGGEQRLIQAREQLRKAEEEDVQAERDVEVLKRKAIRESEQIKWDAIREYGEKLVLLSQAATPIISVLPPIPPTPQQPYTGHGTTGAVRASLQRALDNYKTGHINLPPQGNAADLSRSDTQSFGESHKSELESLYEDDGSTHQGRHGQHGQGQGYGQGSSPPSSYGYGKPAPHAAPPIPIPHHGAHGTPQAYTHPLPGHAAVSQHGSPPINPLALNQAPAPLPHPVVSPTGANAANPLAPSMPTPSHSSSSPASAVAAHDIGSPLAGTTTGSNPIIPAATPTIAETGMPVSAGPDGPGPASGSLHDIKGAHEDAGPRSGGLAGNAPVPEYGQSGAYGQYGQFGDLGGAGGGQQQQPKHESAEEEKKRLAALYSNSQQPPTSSTGPTAGPPPSGGQGYGAPPPHHETAEEEKKRLEREERERLLHSDAAAAQQRQKTEDDLPPYQEPSLQ